MDDSQIPMSDFPKFSRCVIVLFFVLPVIGVILFCIQLQEYIAKLQIHTQNVCNAFNSKYSRNRGVRIEPAGELFRITVQKPGASLSDYQKEGGVLSDQVSTPTTDAGNNAVNPTPGDVPSYYSDPTTPLLSV